MAIALESLRLEQVLGEGELRIPEVHAGDGVDHREVIQQAVRDALPERLRRAPFHDSGEGIEPFRTVDELVRTVRRRMTHHPPQGRVRLRLEQAITPERFVEIEGALLDALEKQDG